MNIWLSLWLRAVEDLHLISLRGLDTEAAQQFRDSIDRRRARKEC